jgi:hypothetical protein
MHVKIGERLQSGVCDTEAIVVRAPPGAVDLTCGGYPMGPPSAERTNSAIPITPGHAEGSLLGNRYHDEVTGLELLVTKSGIGSLYVDGRPLPLKIPKRLPSSD